ncbi:ketosteroid isomerase-like protein [Hephaestia caeni]|uniref:Ketosteroid isomerase-like protein n=1 Tax=Hephaestia caeni TaxID=645617 RepID=A0A397NK68_9SPHN|nr:nuclear transport factor 2 family protein [Hephaestia caeni]RIA37952.1 ketosteroid isomerase-like protein [Hephaestia caeni]
MLDTVQTEAIANRFFAAVEAGDLDAVVAMYAPDVRIWHSRDEADTDIEQSKELLQLFFSRVSNRRYEVVRRHVFDGGFVQEHVTHGTMADGSAMRLPVCFLCHLDATGRITRIAEYLDSSKSPLRGVVQHQAAAL